MDRKAQQAELIFKFGLLLQPLQDVADHPDRYDPHTRARARAKYYADLDRFIHEVQSFAMGEPGHAYEAEYSRALQALNAIRQWAGIHLDNPQELGINLKQYSEQFRNAVLSIPVSPSLDIYEAYTPFSTYCVVKDLCQSVTTTLAWVDRYMDASLFYRYLRDLPSAPAVTLVIWSKPKPDKEFLDISRLYAAERGPDKYRLIVHPDFHDRWLRCDEQIYSLGGSVKDAAQKSDFTISKVDSTPVNFHRIQQMIDNGTELFGPNQRNHL